MTILTGNEIPTTLEGLNTLLQPFVSRGFADSITVSGGSVRFYKDDVNIIALYYATGWGGAVPGATGNNHSTGSDVATQKICLCKGGVIFSRTDNWYFAIAKTNEGKTGLIPVRDGGYSSQAQYPFYTTCSGDNTSLPLFTNGYKICRNSDSGDRTILTKLPVVGTTGSNDYFTTVYAKNIVQWAEDGVQLFDGKKYGCVGPFAMLDE